MEGLGWVSFIWHLLRRTVGSWPTPRLPQPTSPCLLQDGRGSGGGGAAGSRGQGWWLWGKKLG